MMKPKYVLFCILIGFVLLPSFAVAANWILFTTQQHNSLSWYYDKESINSPEALKILGLKMPAVEGNIRSMWIKSSEDKGERLYLAELNCKEGSARLHDDNGKTVYSDASLNYLYDRPIPPDSVLAMLRKAVCH